MAVKFRNSLLGFNKDDVLKYVFSVKETETQNEQKLRSLESQTTTLSAQLEEAQSSLSDLKADNAILAQKVADFESREAEITRLSESIGKLYLVAKANAKTIINAAKENVEISKAAVNKNIETADVTTESLSDIEKELLITAEKFTAELEAIKQKLSDTKTKITDNDEVIEQKESVLDTLMESVNV
ncbi:MAG: hypothetical protein E7525_05750 [Ruminococcaceae bacterium]|nr:hypothetical protein [Oscillospiraceae bacterium]